MTMFRDLPIGATFDWINDAHPQSNSFFSRCIKISDRKYRALADTSPTYRAGTIKAAVFHVELQTTEPPLTAAEIRREIARLEAALKDERNFHVPAGDDADPEGDVRRQIADLLDDLSDLEQTRIEEVE